ncbi:MAG: DUF4230 domain-containing protein [Bryobacterales bacterium]|nr:DUF4230 domain-containing protein [Bryobacterales bacterium]
MIWKRILALLTAALTGVLLTLFVSHQVRVRRTADPAALVREIQALNQLVTVRYRIQKVIGLEEKKVPFGSEKLLLIVQADVLAGIDLTALTPNAIHRSGDTVTIQLPEPRVLHVVIDEKQTKVWDRQITWWTPWVPYNNDLERQARLAAIEDIKNTAIEMGILTDAHKSAQRNIRQLLKSFGIELANAT